MEQLFNHVNWIMSLYKVFKARAELARAHPVGAGAVRKHT